LLVGAEQQLIGDAQQAPLVLATLAYRFLTSFLIFSSFIKSISCFIHTFKVRMQVFRFRFKITCAGGASAVIFLVVFRTILFASKSFISF
jgi:hypothetical protein